jgi:MFS family permease
LFLLYCRLALLCLSLPLLSTSIWFMVTSPPHPFLNTLSFHLPCLAFPLVATPELNAEPQVQTTINILATLPWSFKLVFGFLSDVVPINGQHRKPYLTLGALIYSASYIYYALVAEQNVITLAIATFIGTMGMIMMDVMADTMVNNNKLKQTKTTMTIHVHSCIRGIIPQHIIAVCHECLH